MFLGKGLEHTFEEVDQQSTCYAVYERRSRTAEMRSVMKLQGVSMNSECFMNVPSSGNSFFNFAVPF